MVKKKDQEKGKKKKRKIWSFIFGLLLMLISIPNLLSIPGVIGFLCGLLIFPHISNLIESKLNFKIKTWIKIIIFIVGVIVLTYGNKTPIYEPEIKEIFIPLAHSSCEFQPDKGIIPTEFTIREPKIVNQTCSQTYSQTSIAGKQLAIKISLFNQSTDAKNYINEKISAEKERRGYKELKTEEGCFAIQKELGWHSAAYIYCNWANLAFEETVIDMGIFGNDLYLKKIPKHIQRKVMQFSK